MPTLEQMVDLERYPINDLSHDKTQEVIRECRARLDGNNFTVSILVQAAEAGGIFEYAPDLRSKGNERSDAVKSVLDGDRQRALPIHYEREGYRPDGLTD